jgi:hypothetical protein
MSLLFPQDYFDKLFVLSLGTGQHRRGYSAKEAKKWGAVKWLKHNGDTPLISSLQNASADMVDYNLSIMFGAHQHAGNYLRIQVPLQLLICVKHLYLSLVYVCGFPSA